MECSYYFIMKLFTILCLSALLVLSHEQRSRGQRPSRSGTCGRIRGQKPWNYHAPARAVPPPVVDPAIQLGFLELFQRRFHTNHTHRSPNARRTEESAQASLLNPDVISMIIELCPRDTFFYSFAPRHINATNLLRTEFMAQPNASELLRVAKHELFRHQINRRLWYYALLGATLMRPDFHGYQLAWATDATPDMYLPESILSMATVNASRPPPRRVANECQTATGEMRREVRLMNPEDEIPPGFRSLLSARTRRRYRRPRETSDENFPPSEAMPSSYLEVDENEDFENLKRVKRQENCLLYNGTTGATGEENRLWYFREDLMYTQHHWYWHQYFPQASNRHPDRRGEVFYYVHRNIIARYNAERLSNGLPIETALDYRLGGNIGVGYNSGLSDSQSGKFWTGRGANVNLSDINHQTDQDFLLGVTMNETSTLHATLVSHISQGFLIANQSRHNGQPPTEFQIDILNPEGFGHLANTVEAAEELSLHVNLYHPFGIHNLGHIVIALASDPDFRCQLPTGVLADLTVTPRDPAFYKIHTFVDDLFDIYKQTLPPYQLQEGEWPLIWNGVHLRNVEVITPATGQGGTDGYNWIKTFWSIKRFPLEEGIDGAIHEGDVEMPDICHQHLNHERFILRMTVDVRKCTGNETIRGMARIFMAPRFGLDGQRFNMNETRKLMFQLDAFPVELRQGRNIITRNSEDSSATKPWSRSLDQMINDPSNGGQAEYCACGHPDHLQIPKGTAEGMKYDLFAMITDFTQDRVQDTPEDRSIPEACNMPYLLCGIPYKKYPDKRPLGYPFDRLPYSVMDKRTRRETMVASLEEYVRNVPNMRAATIFVQNLDIVVN